MESTEKMPCGGRRSVVHHVRCGAAPMGVAVYDGESAPGVHSEGPVEDGSESAGDGEWGHCLSQPVGGEWLEGPSLVPTSRHSRGLCWHQECPRSVQYDRHLEFRNY